MYHYLTDILRAKTSRKTPLLRQCLFTLLLLLLSAVAHGENEGEPMIMPGISASMVGQDLLSRSNVYLVKLVASPDERRDYVKSLDRSRMIEEEIQKRGIERNQRLLEGLRNARERLLLEALIDDEMAKKAVDVEALARERYEATKDQQIIRKKIKIAVIYLGKGRDREDEARARIGDIHTRLMADPYNDELFSELARQYSEDKRAPQGGIIKQWLIAPPDLEERDPLMQAAFAVDSIGQMTEVIETESGFSMARLMSVTPAVPLDFDTVRDDLMEEVHSELYKQTRVDILQSMQPEEGLAIADTLLERAVREVSEARGLVVNEEK